MQIMKQIIGLLTLITVSIWLAVFSLNESLHIVACDVGQGDAILIQRLNTQILIDGGPNQKVLNCLGKHMPFWDRQIELVINTHPELDHYGGLIDVAKTYKIDAFASNGQVSSSQEYQVLEKLVGSNGVERLILHQGINLRVGLIYLDILWPIAENKNSKIKIQNYETNNNGVVILLKYDRFKALFTADVENKISDKLSSLSEVEGINYIKVNHHGSKNGLSQKLLDTAKPKTAVISVGKNSYGHPHQEILEILKNANTKILRTDQLGDVVYYYK